jgi:hypothetical protein
MPKVRTYTDEHARRLRAKHAQSDDYGRHRHLYLHDAMRSLAVSVARAGQKPTLLDYGCGKGQFIEEMRKLDIFGDIAGFDPGYAAFQTLPHGRFDIVSCLDVLDAAEKRFLDAIVSDVALRTAKVALFDCLTKPLPKSGFIPRPPHYWYERIKKTMEIAGMTIHFPGMDGFERAVILAKPRI